MTDDEEFRFRPRPGRVRADAPRLGKAKSFLTQAKKIARQQSNSPARSSRRSGAKPNATGGKASKANSGPGLKRGRGAAFVRSRTLSGGWRHSARGMRRVVVKTRYVQSAGRNGKSAAHLRYIQRDGTSRDGERGQLYSATEDRADGDAFVERGADDRHQFRFIASPEDGADLSDLTAHTRDLMSQVEADLGTRLDWVAVNHHNTGHPHVHVIVRGKDELGEDLVINGDYLSNGIRERASELTTLELGPVTEIEQSRKLSAEIDQDRFTRIDRAMTEEADERFLDLRNEPADPRRQLDRTLRLRRLARLEKMGLATEHAPGVWEISERMEPTLREMGERGDIIRNMHEALKADGLERDPMTFQIHDAAPEVPIVGRVVDKYLSDELGENLTVVVDGIDGRTHHVPGIDPDRRREHHIDQGDATRKSDGRVFYRRNLLGTLREREVASAGAEMAASKALPFRAATDGERVSGKFTGTVQLSSGKFAVVEQSHEFTLVPWRPVIDRQLGKEISGIVQGGSVSWQLGRTRGIGL